MVTACAGTSAPAWCRRAGQSLHPTVVGAAPVRTTAPEGAIVGVGSPPLPTSRMGLSRDQVVCHHLIPELFEHVRVVLRLGENSDFNDLKRAGLTGATQEGALGMQGPSGQFRVVWANCRSRTTHRPAEHSRGGISWPEAAAKLVARPSLDEAQVPDGAEKVGYSEAGRGRCR